ncbi:hypothetical protein BX659_14310 [Orenia metallireducens]|uniref:DUF2357 domain-containing protein n=1 Tax=Orenia metallireducens TaxID=1413210 RepID=A0A285IFH9_9FIRM|nr:restriction endonuclease-like protein [Orenia metallireducens]PRX18491.1 hypothetical protein BX659_14310 [Orenia metallireducens]SNY46702.1 hypothetical protein SAMN06265827_14410 [Orenia metallireducens]
MSYQGNDIELIYIETQYFTFTIKGKPIHPDIDHLCPNRDNSAIKATLAVDPINCELHEFLHFDPDEDLKPYQGESVFPFFYEWQDYQVIIESKNDKELEFHHENKLIREAVAPLSRNKSILMGKFNFRNDVGYSELEIRRDGSPLLILKIEVFPSKIDYQRDYYNLIREVNEEVYNLAYDFLRKTFQNMRLTEAENISDSEFFTILKTIFNGFKKAFRRIEKFPHHRLNQIRKVKPSGRVKKVNKQSIKWLRKNPKFYDKEYGLPTKLLDINKQVSFDTYENKFVKWIILQIIKRIKRFILEYQNFYKEKADIQVVEFANKMVRELDLMLSRTFLKDVGELYKVDSLSLVLQMAPGYREIYKYYLMLKKGLSFNGELFRLSMKETWKLYEYWCFLKLNQILRKKYNLVKNNLIEFNYSGIYVSLNTSSSAAVEYENPATGEKFTLSYNTKEGKKVTTGQKPDNVLSLRKQGSNVDYKFVFDAKYRINPAYPDTYYGRTYNEIPGPEEDTINTMHRYRDAIVYQDPNQINRTMVGAYVLFPYHDEEKYKEHKFYKSIDQVNVGAFPFLPGSIELVSEFLEGLIEESSMSNYERNILPQGTSEYQGKVEFERNVLVGSLRTKKQRNHILDKKFYHIPYKKGLEAYNLKYICFYQDKGKFKKEDGIRYYGRLKRYEVRKRKNIDVPMNPNKNNGQQLYYVFHVDKWYQLDNPIVSDGYGIRGSHIYTNDMLLFKAKTLPELSIKTLEEWRVWLELSRLRKDIRTIINDNKINDTTNISGFQIDNVKVEVINDQVVISRGEKIINSGLREFMFNTRRIMREIF